MQFDSSAQTERGKGRGMMRAAKAKISSAHNLGVFVENKGSHLLPLIR